MTFSFIVSNPYQQQNTEQQAELDSIQKKLAIAQAKKQLEQLNGNTSNSKQSQLDDLNYQLAIKQAQDRLNGGNSILSQDKQQFNQNFGQYKQLSDYDFGKQSQAWSLANDYRMKEAGQQIQGQKDITGMQQEGETKRTGMSLDTQKEMQLQGFANQSRQKEQDYGRAIRGYTGRY